MLTGRGWRAPRTALVVVLVLALSVLAAPSGGAAGRAAAPTGVGAPQAPAALAASSVPVFPVDQVRPGMVGRGLTTLQGKTVVSFGARVIAVLEDGILPGIDMIVVETFGDAIERNGGVSFGMSGSPVYIGGRLLGAVAFGACCSGDLLRIAGLTPASAMLEVLRFPTRAARVAASWPTAVRLPESVRSAVREATGATAPQLTELSVPITVSGLRRSRLGLIQRKLDPDGRFQFQLSSGASRPRRGQPLEPLSPGSNYAAVLSYGDLTLAGVGTTTLVVGKRSVGWGHPFFLTGRTRLGLNGATNLGVLKSGFFPTEELLALSGFHGVVNQDRFTGIAGTKGVFPALVGIHSAVTNTDIRRTFRGATFALHGVPFFTVSDVAFVAFLSQLDRALLKIGEGSSALSWTIRGTRAGGEGFTFRRSDLFFDEFDVSLMSLLEFVSNAFAIQQNPFEPVKLTGFSLSGRVDERRRFVDIVQVAVSSPSNPEPVTQGPIFVQPGETLTVHVTLRRPGGQLRSRTLDLQVPEFAAGSLTLSVRGGPGGGLFGPEAFVEGGAPAQAGAPPQSLDELLDQLANADHNNDLVAELSTFLEDPAGGFQEALAKQVVTLKTVVRGAFAFEVVVGGEGGPPPEPVPVG
ncbi:MAG TPA: hypothetical protein VNO34_09460 [Actinomycetota bacterium]|nr:hypothetical protein [Actinomycetota bacterium]